MAGDIRRWYGRPKTVTHLSTYWAQRRVTSLIRPTYAVTVAPDRHIKRVPLVGHKIALLDDIVIAARTPEELIDRLRQVHSLTVFVK